jgi:hypothetical protein
MTMGPGARVAALLGALRPIADEIIVALDDRAGEEVRADVAAVADRVVVYPYAEPVDRPLPWLFEQCRGDWVLLIDDDEIPSLALLDELPDLCADRSVTHYSLPRKWLFPDPSTYLDDWPWRPDYQLRLVRRDPRVVRFSAEFHRPIVAAGPGRFPQLPLWHSDSLLRPVEQRLEKARRYERTRPGMRIAGRALNFAFYVPELREKPPLAAVPPDERAFIESVLAAARPSGPARAQTEQATREAIDALWPEADTSAHAGRLELHERPSAMGPGERRTLDVHVENTGRATWQWGGDAIAEVRLGSRWFDASGAEVSAVQLHGEFPAPLAPRAADVVPVPIQAPETPGRYRIEIDLVHEHVRWLDAAVSTDVLVRKRHRVVLFAGAAAASVVVPVLLESIPELEPIVLSSAPTTRPDRYPEAPDLHAFLLGDPPQHRGGVVAAVLWRTLRLKAAASRAGRARLPRGGDEFLDALRGAELLVLDQLGTPYHRRELWRALVAVRVAAALGVPTAVRRGAAGGSRLSRIVERAAAHTYEDPSELVALLHELVEPGPPA